VGCFTPATASLLTEVPNSIHNYLLGCLLPLPRRQNARPVRHRPTVQVGKKQLKMTMQSRMLLSMKSARAVLQQFTKDTTRCELWLSSLRLSLTTRTQDTKRTVAIKAVRRDILTAKLFDNLQSEIDILKSLSHRHITKLIDIVVSADCAKNFVIYAH
jgi:hypothetical protein